MRQSNKKSITKKMEAINDIKSATTVAKIVSAEITKEVPRRTELAKISESMELLPVNDIFRQKLHEHGLTEDQVAIWLKELFNWETVKIDKNGNTFSYVDGNLRLKAIEIWAKATGYTGKTGDVTNNILNLGSLTDDKLDALAREASKIRADKKKS